MTSYKHVEGGPGAAHLAGCVHAAEEATMDAEGVLDHLAPRPGKKKKAT